MQIFTTTSTSSVPSNCTPKYEAESIAHVGDKTVLNTPSEGTSYSDSKMQLLEDYYPKIWNATYINSEKASHTKPLIPSIFHRMFLPLRPNHILTQLLTNHGCLRSYLHNMKKAPTPLCSCPEKAEQTTRHLMIECSLFSKERPAVL